ncbi:MAG: hypothetical protein U0103_04735 [Candidatus Obscuribacterales bacterium]|nr:hypothetical protein [Cyanobacteria bacterium SZAS LIN-5]RTL43723.1 MAG: hypothetical protein EKK48_08230 [Candidatus Melainabacteria bacterium]
MYGRSHAQVAQDVHYSIGDSGVKIIFGGIILIGVVAFIAYIMDNQDISNSAAWPTTQGKLEQIVDQGASMAFVGKFLPIVTPYAKYTYTVNGREYSGEKHGGPCLSYIRALTFRQPEIEKLSTDELMKKFEVKRNAAGAIDNSAFDKEMMSALTEGTTFGMKYKPIKVRFDKDHPDKSVLDPDVLQTDKSQLYTSIALILLGAVLLGGTYLNGYMAQAASEDPSLSLEGALAAQRNSRYGSRR